MASRRVKFSVEYDAELGRDVTYIDCHCRSNDRRCGDWCPCCQLIFPASINAVAPTGVRIRCGEPLSYDGDPEEDVNS